jgi:hypothetical protein
MSEKKLEDKIQTFNFEALKGTIAHDPVFRGAVETFKKLAAQNPQTFDALLGLVNIQANEKREQLGIKDMTSEQILDSIFSDIEELPASEQRQYLDQIARARDRKAKHKLRVEGLLAELSAAIGSQKDLRKLVAKVLFEGLYDKPNVIGLGTATLQSGKPESALEQQARQQALSEMKIQRSGDDKRFYPEDLGALLRSGQFSSDDIGKITRAVDVSQKVFQETYEQILENLKQGMKTIDPPSKRVLQ